MKQKQIKNGNLVKGFDKYYEYNAFNQLTRIKNNNSNGKFIAEFIYDADGKRIKKIETINNANTTTYYIGDKRLE